MSINYRILRTDKQVLASALDLLIDDDLLVVTKSGNLSSKFILLQLAERNTLSKTRAKAGRKGGKVKQLNRRSKCQASVKQNLAILESEVELESEVDNTPIAPKGAEYTKDFESFWEVYPKKKAKGAAFRAWKRAKGKPDINRLREIVRDHTESKEWKKDSGKFIPNPATWINGACWDDVLNQSFGKRREELCW